MAMTSGAAAGSQPRGTAGTWIWQVSFEDGPKNRSYGGPADKSLWLDMSEEHQQRLDEAVAGSLLSVDLAIPYTTKKGEEKTSALRVDLTTMTQTNLESRKQRKIRRVQLWPGFTVQEIANSSGKPGEEEAARSQGPGKQGDGDEDPFSVRGPFM